jgi:GH24 family phage-related lysozyme (muramidase)
MTVMTPAIRASLLEEARSRGLLDNSAVLEAPDGDTEFVDWFKDQMKATDKYDTRRPVEDQFLIATADFIENSEGRRFLAYDDATSRPIASRGRKVKGHPTIGVGFNLDRPDARETIEKLGLDFDRVYAGLDRMSNNQINQVLAKDVKDHSEAVKAIFPGKKFAAHELRALTSLHFNLPGLIGSGLQAAINSGNNMAAEHEIRNRSNAGQIPGLQKRRHLEADEFIGGFREGGINNFKPPVKPTGPDTPPPAPPKPQPGV